METRAAIVCFEQYVPFVTMFLKTTILQRRQKASICGQGLKLYNYDYNPIIEERDNTDCTTVCFIRDHIRYKIAESP